MRYLYDYMTESELAMAQESAQLELEAMRIQHGFETCRMEHELRLKAIDTRMVLENYTEDDLTQLYTREMQVYTEGVKELCSIK